MANYIRNAQIGAKPGPDPYPEFETLFHGASEAPRVHGLQNKIWENTPRFKNHYLVAFQFSDKSSLAAHGALGSGLNSITHKVRSIDAPKYDIEIETLNHYNKPRIIPTKITYQPITITFWDDRSNLTTDFWKEVYKFYFLNGHRPTTNQYNISDSDVTHTELGTMHLPPYKNYGYYVGNKYMSKNLFLYMSLYLVANKHCHRIDLINPYLQSMQHDQFSQEMSNELAQNTTTWAYENVVYYNKTPIDNEDALKGVGFSTNPSSPAHSVFQADDFEPNDPSRLTYANGNYVNTATAPTGPVPDNTPAYPGQQSADDLGFGDDMGAEESLFNWSTRAKPLYTLSTKFPETGFAPKSGIDSTISEIYTRLAAPKISTHPGAVKEMEVATQVDSFDPNAWKAAPTDQSALDRLKTGSETSGPATGTNLRPTRTVDLSGIPFSLNPAAAAAYSKRIVNNVAAMHPALQAEVNKFNALPKAEQDKIRKESAARTEARKADRR
jgi:hypothetical protein